MLSTTPTATARSRRRARQGLALYLSVVLVLSAPLETGIILTGALDDTATSILWLTGLMFVPAIASVAARLVLREGFADVSFRLGGRHGRRALLHAIALPLVVGIIAYGSAWTAGLIGIQLPPLRQWLVLLAVLLVLNAVLGFGEELGWRGYMVTRLVGAGIPAPLLVSGLLWGFWHIPLYLWGGFVRDSPSTTFSTVMMLVLTTALGHILARTRLGTGSIWPAVALHAAWNLTIQTGFDPLATGDDKALWVGEIGVITTAAVIIVALIQARRTRPGHSSSGTSPGKGWSMRSRVDRQFPVDRIAPQRR
jgi:membrane protease YdiL (CAAX protease family)